VRTPDLATFISILDLAVKDRAQLVLENAGRAAHG